MQRFNSNFVNFKLNLFAFATIATAVTSLLTFASTRAHAQLKLPTIIGSNMVLQQKAKAPIWGWDKPGSTVKITISDQSHTATADKTGRWQVALKPMLASFKPVKMTIKGSDTTINLTNILIGEVWVCSGQSNMQWPVAAAYDADIEKLTANLPNIRHISVPQVGTQSPQTHFKGQWESFTPQNVSNFSAVGYFFGRRLHQTLNVPVGLIDNAWGGSAAEAWVRRDLLEADKRYAPLLEQWDGIAKTYNSEKLETAYQKRLAKWKDDAKKARAAKKPVPRAPRRPRNPLTGQHRPANLYNGVLNPIIGYGIKGAIWYQGESNSNRAYQYRHLFPLMIQNWRDDWKQGDFPFYWVQLADFRSEAEEPGDSTWAELREAQTMTWKTLPHTGEAVIIDVGEGKDIHPKDKKTVANRLARWALFNQYDVKVPYRSPYYKSLTVNGNKATVTLDAVGRGLKTFDTANITGFAIAGKDKKFYWAKAKITGKDKVEVWADEVKEPIAVRYAWADNPVCNLYSGEDLPATPFRTDDWPGITKDKTTR
jgi:sialate O-acetylesterase